MITRATWFVAGAAAGAVGATYTRRKVKAVAEQMAPVNVAKSVAGRARSRGRDLVEAVKEGRLAMRAKEDRAAGRPRRRGAAPSPRRPRSSCSRTSASWSSSRAVSREAAPPREPRVSADHPSGRRRRSRR